MKKLISLILVLCIMLSLFGCKKQDDEQTAAAGELTEQTEQASEKEEQKEQEPSESYGEDLNIDRAICLDIEKGGVTYTKYLNNGRAMNPTTFICKYEDFDRSLLKETQEKVTVKYKRHTANDGVEYFAETTATVYAFPDYIENDPSIEVIAAKLDTNGEIMIFSTMKEIEADYSIGAFLALGWSDEEKEQGLYNGICKIEILRLGENVGQVVITDKQTIKEFYEKIEKFDEKAEETRTPQEKISYKITMYRDESPWNGSVWKTCEYDTKSGFFNIGAVARNGTADFEDYLKSFFEE